MTATAEPVDPQDAVLDATEDWINDVIAQRADQEGQSE